MAEISQEDITKLEEQGSLDLTVENTPVTVEAADVEIISEDIPGWLVSNEGNLTVALEVEISDELRKEGMARELINRIQNLRKDAGLEITDRISVQVSPQEETNQAIESYGEYISNQVLADSIIVKDNDGTLVEFDDFDLHILIQKV